MMLYKIVVLGEGGVGKTSLTIQAYDPTIEDSYRKQVIIDELPCVLEIWDTAGQEQYIALRDGWIREGEGFLLVYSITSRSTFERIELLHDQIRRVKDNVPAPVMLVGNKCDKITEREVSREEAMNLARRLKCDFIESSAKANTNVHKAFYGVVRMIRRNREQNREILKKRKKTKCIIL
ncbi:17989_t:CDS:2 [Dentiscutata erythropus]|uniref:17989_t:CDS:1 n=1 Tax=Dentiscutata erythropus TaxID=1348616 RepID=A0A9N8YTB2_9GLOM|nr:17989_t:CDS:2 [Dentiscutata erythropus]